LGDKLIFVFRDFRNHVFFLPTGAKVVFEAEKIGI